MPQPSRALVLDAGGVLVRTGSDAPRRAWERLHWRDPGFLDAAVAEAIGPGWAGGRTEDEIERRLLQLTGVPEEEYDALLRLLATHEELDESLVALIRALRGRVRTAVLTNAGPGRRAELVDRFAVDELVDLVVVSAEEGISKPDPEIYRLTAQRLGVGAEACVFVDDDPANVRGAERVGMVGVVFRGADDLERRLDKVGLGAHRGACAGRTP